LQEGDLIGLTEAQALERLKTDGPNELPSSKPRTIWAIACGVVREPMFLLLLAAGGIYLLLGDLEEALLLLGFVFVVIGITLYQERKTERALEALRDLSSPRALVIREGQRRRIAGRDVVCGDLLVLSEGDRVPADAVLLSSTNLSADESLLTGESVPVRKNAGEPDLSCGRPGGDDLPFVYSGTLIVGGQGIARVCATGARTELGKIGKALQTVETEDTPLQKQTRRLVTILATVGLSLCVVVALGYGLTRADWLNGLLAGIALAMAMLPEEFPVVLMIFLALGAWRISQNRVLTRRIPAVETLGSATVLCVDKTGTLTQNRMSVRKLAVDGCVLDMAQVSGPDSLAEQFHPVIEFSILASSENPYDPMEVAFKEFGEQHFTGTEHLHTDWRLVREYPLSREQLSVTRVWDTGSASTLAVAAKGAPEAISRLCRFDPEQDRRLAEQVRKLASEGLRVLGVASARFEGSNLPDSQDGFNFHFAGLVGLADPIRPTVPEAIRECYTAGVRVVMITGDYPATALSIAEQIGLTPRDAVVTGPELDRISDDELRKKVQTTNVFARVVPEQKLRLVSALKANGQVVAMTGDGVNDAPALKAAHIGVAMGGRGTDVARESASLVLLDDDFSSIVRAVRMGRRIFDNLKKAMAYVLAIHVPIAGMSLIPVLLKWPLALLPVHIVFLELIIDPACSTAFEAEKEEPNVMNRPPRNPSEPIFGLRTTAIALLQGLSVLAVVAGIFAWAMHTGKPEPYARALAFTTLIVSNLSLIWTNRSWSRTVLHTLGSRNIALWSVTAGAMSLLVVVLSVPFLRELFRLSALSIRAFASCLLAGCASILWFELVKLVSRTRATKPLSFDSSLTESAMKCPGCKTDVNLLMTERQGVEIDYCPECRGIWLDRGELDKIIERSMTVSDSPAEGRFYGRDDHEHKEHGYEHGHHGHQGHYGRKRNWLSDLFD
jgi:Ca2+-transporting ATPase